MKPILFLTLLMSMLAISPAVNAAIVYNEAISGDAGVGPSYVNLGNLTTGSHQIIGGNPDFDADDYSITIPSGFQLDSILIENYTAIGSAGFQSPVLGSASLSAASAGQDFLDLASISQPLGAGTYLFRVTTGTGGPTTYQFDFQVTAVPEPSSVALGGLGLFLLGGVARRRRRVQ